MIFSLVFIFVGSFSFEDVFNATLSDLKDQSGYYHFEADYGWTDEYFCSYITNSDDVFDDSSGEYLDLIASSSECPEICESYGVKHPLLKSLDTTLSTGYYGVVIQHSKKFTTGLCGVIGIVEIDGTDELYDENHIALNIFYDEMTVIIDHGGTNTVWEDHINIGNTNDEFHEYGFVFECDKVSFYKDGEIVQDRGVYVESGGILPDCTAEYMFYSAFRADACEMESDNFGAYRVSDLPLRYHLLGLRYHQGVTTYPPLPYNRSSIIVKDLNIKGGGGDDGDDIIKGGDGEDDKDGDLTLVYAIVFPTVGVLGGSTFLLLILCIVLFCGIIVIFLGIVICLFLVSSSSVSAYFLFCKKKGVDNFGKELQDSISQETKDKLAAGTALFEQKKNLFVVDWKTIKLQQTIGEGGGGATIYRAKWEGGRQVAFKIFNVTDVTEISDFEDFERELTVSSSISHPNILRFFGCSLKIPRVGIVMEFCENGDLTYYTERNKGDIELFTKLKILWGVSAGMVYLHNRDIIHRDLKGKNILLSKGMEPKICDFGLSRVVDRKTMNMTKRVGTCYYIAPEVILGDKYDEKCDVFSFSLVIYELIFENCRPYGNDVFAIENRIANNENLRPVIPDNHGFPGWIIEMMVSSWKGSAEKRPSFNEIQVKFGEEVERLEEQFE